MYPKKKKYRVNVFRNYSNLTLKGGSALYFLLSNSRELHLSLLAERRKLQNSVELRVHDNYATLSLGSVSC